ncbi:hypothetical protein [Nocardia sp. NBC_01329]|uniref:hypothetical protein n=1 Tax=Nocardia sp. NBC_01329 TaxID=2903594 RepID=UPI002E1188C5|nr:hypothetical protein OG405_27180 [Nocardia sp. NBC_01329]
MATRSAVRFAALAAMCAGTLLLGACSDNEGTAVPVAPAAAQQQSETPQEPQSETPQERSIRVRDELTRLGCDTNSCIQTYFACEDGLLAGEACEFYRTHPMK